MNRKTAIRNFINIHRIEMHFSCKLMNPLRWAAKPALLSRLMQPWPDCPRQKNTRQIAAATLDSRHQNNVLTL
jgi:hypothetical protein